MQFILNRLYGSQFYWKWTSLSEIVFNITIVQFRFLQSSYMFIILHNEKNLLRFVWFNIIYSEVKIKKKISIAEYNEAPDLQTYWLVLEMWGLAHSETLSYEIPKILFCSIKYCSYWRTLLKNKILHWFYGCLQLCFLSAFG